MHRWFICACVLALGTTAVRAAGNDPETPKKLPPALAQLIQGSAGDFLKHFDKGQKGYLSKDDLPPRLTQAFDRFDTNGDGKLNQQEIGQMLQKLRQRFDLASASTPSATPEVEKFVNQMLQRMDTNKDGKISKEEAKGALAERFDQVDANHDGFLDRDELRRVAVRFLANQKGKPEAGRASQGVQIPDFDALDRNADGRLTRDELQGTPYADLFDQIDTSKNGQIDRKEFEGYFRKQAEKQEKK